MGGEAMSRVKNSGFYKLQFLITPAEFQRVVELLVSKQARFHRTHYGQPQHQAEQVLEEYGTYYQYFTAQEKPDYYPFFVYSIVVEAGEERAGFAVRNVGLAFPDGRQWAQDELPYIMLSFPKGYRIDEEDGAYYRYEDCRVHYPLAYALYEEVASEVKGCTKLLRFWAQAEDGLQEQKPAVRISKDALEELSQGWLWRQNGLVLKHM